jgi:hypothetical protein
MSSMNLLYGLFTLTILLAKSLRFCDAIKLPPACLATLGDVAPTKLFLFMLNRPRVAKASRFALSPAVMAKETSPRSITLSNVCFFNVSY